MKARALKFCLFSDLLAFALLALSYAVVDYYEVHQDGGFYLGPGLLFCSSFMLTVTALVTTLIVVLFWPSEPTLAGIGLSPDQPSDR